MRILFFLASLLFIISFPACNKDDDNNPNPTLKLLDYYTLTNYPDTVSFEYNSSGQLNREESTEEIHTLTINGNQLHYTEYRKDETRTVADATFTLNAAGNIASGHGDFSYNQAGIYSADFTFTYDNAGNLIKRTDARNNGMTYSYDYVWTNGDITSIRWNLNDTLYLTISLSYDLNLEDKLQLDENTFFMAMNDFVGNHNKHLRTHSNTVFAPGSIIEQRYDFGFTVDSDGFPLIQTVTSLDNPYSDVLHYFYK